MVAVPSHELLGAFLKTARPVSFAPRGPMILRRLRRGLRLHFLSFLANVIHPVHWGIAVAASTLRLEMVWYRRISCCLLYSGCIPLCLPNI